MPSDNMEISQDVSAAPILYSTCRVYFIHLGRAREVTIEPGCDLPGHRKSMWVLVLVKERYGGWWWSNSKEEMEAPVFCLGALSSFAQGRVRTRGRNDRRRGQLTILLHNTPYTLRREDSAASEGLSSYLFVCCCNHEIERSMVVFRSRNVSAHRYQCFEAEIVCKTCIRYWWTQIYWLAPHLLHTTVPTRRSMMAPATVTSRRVHRISQPCQPEYNSWSTQSSHRYRLLQTILFLPEVLYIPAHTSDHHRVFFDWPPL